MLLNNNTSFDFSIFHEEFSDNYSSIIPLNEDDNFDIFPFNESDGTILKKYKKLQRFRTTKKEKNKIRKEKFDNIRKKIKTHFHKKIREIINDKLKTVGSKEYFESFPQTFISNISIKTNNAIMELTYIELFEHTYLETFNHYNKLKNKNANNKRIINIAEKKYNKNKKVLEYLKTNSNISEISGWNKIKDIKYINLLKAYFISKEFEQSIDILSRKENLHYVDDYIHCALTYIEHFSNN